MKYVFIFLLFACASKSDFRDSKKSVLVCSTIANAPTTDEVKIFRTTPVQWTWEELSKGELKLIRHERTLKAFLPHKFKEDKDPHQAIIVWNFDLEKGFDTAYLKREIKKTAKSLEFNNMFDPPSIKRAIFTGGDLVLLNQYGIKDKNYDHGHLAHSFNRTSMVLKQFKAAEAGELCLKRLEDDPPQVQEEEEFKLELLTPL